MEACPLQLFFVCGAENLHRDWIGKDHRGVVKLVCRAPQGYAKSGSGW